MEQFLGALNFARDVDRTLVLPHLVEYPHGRASVNDRIFFNQILNVLNCSKAEANKIL